MQKWLTDFVTASRNSVNLNIFYFASNANMNTKSHFSFVVFMQWPLSKHGKKSVKMKFLDVHIDSQERTHICHVVI
jgi:hypothetical protein